MDKCLGYEKSSFSAIGCNELKNCGVEDILIACRNKLGGFLKAIEDVLSKTEQQLCVIHQIRNKADLWGSHLR